MKRKITFMMLAIAMLSITSCKASPMREQVNIDCVLQDGTLTADFCGYFPANNPQYTILVSVHRKEIPASGGRMSAPIFKEIAEFIYDSMNRY